MNKMIWRAVMGASAGLVAMAAHADGVQTLRTFVKEVNSGRGAFTQVVTSPDGKRVRKSSGSLEFQRPNQFRFTYQTPAEQVIVGDGKKVWMWDADLNQVAVRPMTQAMGSTPAALLAGGSLDKDFVLKNVAASSTSAAAATSAGSQQRDASIEWVEALPRTKDGQFQSVRVGFRGPNLAALEILDSFGQRSRLDFTQFESKVTLPAARFQFTPPQGADVLNQQ
ncbi:MAG: outer membrane lipoprotein chaperone LolA [Aquabacterium sp.]